MRRIFESLTLAACLACAPLAPPAAGPPTPAAKQATSGTSVKPIPIFAAPGGPMPAPDACTPTVHPFRQPLVVANDLDIPRYPPVVGFPMGFPRAGDLRSLTGFHAITLDGESLSSQVETMSRWGDAPGSCDAPIRWAYAFALADVPPKSRVYLGLERQVDGTPNSPMAMKVEETPAQVVVDTGPARFTIRKDRFNGLSKVELKSADAWTTISETPASDQAGMLVLEGSGVASPIHGKQLAFEVERRGPAVATIAIKGTYSLPKKPQLFRFTVRLHFYTGTGAVLLEHTYYNGETETFSADGAKNLAHSDRVYWKMPLALGAGPKVTARAKEKLHTLAPTEVVSLQQDKRGPSRPNPVYAVLNGKAQLELGVFADDPFLAVEGPAGRVVSTIAWLGFRDPQALRYDPKAQALEIDFQSEAMSIGGARGIWSKVALDFSSGAVDLGLRGRQLYAHATRPLIGVPNLAYLNTTHAYAALPEKALPSRYAKFDEDVDRLHKTTVDYLRKYRITGTQIWPDMPRASCTLDGSCENLEKGYFDGGDDNYWDWSLVELEQYLRSGDPAFVHDFAFAEALTMAETASFRPDWYTKAGESSFAGFSPCYGGGRGFDGVWNEGLNHRTGSCPGDYSYNKVHRLAYLLTADRRFLDFFDDGAGTVIRLYGEQPKERPPEWLELSATRQSNQYIESLLNAAEFSQRGAAHSKRLQKIVVGYMDFLLKNGLERGHTCGFNGTGHASPRTKGECSSMATWMMPIMVDWVARVAFYFDHPGAKAWLFDWAKMVIKRTTVLTSDGRPDISAERSTANDDNGNGWRTGYRCKATAKGIDDKTCKKETGGENSNFYYGDGVIAFLNAFGAVAEADPQDTLKLCSWYPEAWEAALKKMVPFELNDYAWGKTPGQAYAFAQRALAALERCP